MLSKNFYVWALVFAASGTHADTASLSRLEIPALTVSENVKLRFGGYADIGFFRALGNGRAYDFDAANNRFFGDPFANPVNAQGEPADLGLADHPITRFDSIRSGGKANFIVNNVNLTILASAAKWLLFEGSLNFEPRPQNLETVGALLNADLAYLELSPFETWDFHIYAGKFESTFGIEYRRRKAPDRFGITPSIMSRYTIGTPTGVKVRGSFFDEILTYNLAVSNQGMLTERFGRFAYDDTQFLDFKTISGRLSLGKRFDIGIPLDVEIGGSGLYQPPDLGPPTAMHWQAGADLRVKLDDFELRAEYLQSHSQQGDDLNEPYLHSQGLYGEATYQIFPWLGALARADWRKATMLSELEEVRSLFVTNTFRFTGALRFDITYNVVAKIEYTTIRELDTPDIPDDVFTSSLIFRF